MEHDEMMQAASQQPDPGPEEGSLVSEYGLLAVLGATLVGVAISWAQGGAVTTLLDGVLRQARALAGF